VVAPHRRRPVVTAREEILGSIRAALRDVEPLPPSAPSRDPRPGRTQQELVDLFVERVRDYHAVVERCSPAELGDVVRAALPVGGSVVVPQGLSVDVGGAVVDGVGGPGLGVRELDRMDAVVTDARVGIAETGTLVLDHNLGEGRRALTLVPDHHVCVVRAHQIVADVGDALALVEPIRPQTWISGPSATSDIELERVEGVHGPRRLHLILVEEIT
jgi:L-lactate dehydrogenase complex protein LldG